MSVGARANQKPSTLVLILEHVIEDIGVSKERVGAQFYWLVNNVPNYFQSSAPIVVLSSQTTFGQEEGAAQPDLWNLVSDYTGKRTRNQGNPCRPVQGFSPNEMLQIKALSSRAACAFC
jgi:hypothetical protein